MFNTRKHFQVRQANEPAKILRYNLGEQIQQSAQMNGIEDEGIENT